ncbi:cytochrome P450, putative [Talaromyces stipitatus ATCC 10500]|uniref:Cytochrome P450, putative n=1 Tax=Talaromyces stipitatus (strain ATCC 10500 / CBS 375.48 / QM 6759 / NRRL 1006) TaxID=441959 RepID=B8MPJ8_TALSN|nr:cytochrome P450, putative [Talaromyces stipitatus ATCC 10500]EED14437.1 cytochrome P450, putative [Talaromyces stipitatus ATCC 10500]
MAPRIISSLSITEAAVLLSGAFFAYVVGVVIYRIYFHPLSKYPGPKLAAATRLWWMKQQLSGRFPFIVHELHLKYGEIVRIAPTELSFTGADAWKEIYGFRNGLPENRKDPGENTDADKSHPTIINADRRTHGNLRKLLSNAFSDKVLKGQEPVLLHYIDLLVSRLHEVADKREEPVDIVRWFNYVTFDIIGHLAFYEPFDCLKNNDYHPWMSMIFNAIVYVHYIRTLQRFIDIRSIILAIMPKRIVERRKWHIGLVEEKVKRRKTRHPDYIDFMSHLLQAEEKGHLTLPDLVANANLMVIAGSETTATILSGTIYYLCTHPRVMQKLLDEVRTSFNSSDEINIARISHLKYINAVIDESFRLYPPAAGSHPRITPPEGAMILGQWLPGNTSMGMAQYAVFRSPYNFKDPEIYLPERWLDEEGPYKDDRREALQPFSFGPRNCIGRNLANIEMRLILAKMLWHFDFELTPECANWPKDQYIYTSWEKIPLKVHITTRVKS